MNPFDISLFNFLHASADQWFLLDWLAILCAVYMGYVLVALFVLFVMHEKDRKKRAYAVAWALLSAIGARGIIAQAFYFFTMRQRPFVALGIEPVFDHAAVSSFPSGHMALYATLIMPMWYLNRKWGMMYAGAVGLMGIARIYGAVHWPTDILGGLAIALAVSYGIRYVLFGTLRQQGTVDTQ